MKKLILIICLWPALVMAHDNGHDWETNTTVTNNTYESYVNQTGVASAIAQAQIARDWNTTRPQIGIGAGRFEGNTAFAIGGAYKLCNDCPLITGSVSRENGITSSGIGLNWRF